MKVGRALLSVSDKTGIVEFASALHKLGIELISTGGTAKRLSENKIPVVEVSSLTGFPEMLDGRVKTLHPKVHGGILADRGNKKHMKAVSDAGIKTIDLVCVNLYPFQKTVESGAKLPEIIENIDVGGPALIRAAAKNFEHVAVIVNPNRYNSLLGELSENKLSLSEKTLSSLAVEAFSHTAAYDALIQQELGKRLTPEDVFPEKLTLTFNREKELRYGENPHQKAAFYGEPIVKESCVVGARQLHGKQLSFNNILDIDNAFEIVKEFDKPTAVVVKHNNPSGVASAEKISKAFELAHAADPLSAFGCVVALNRKLDYATAELISKLFIEAVIAPGFDTKALALLKEKKNIRLLEVDRVGKPGEGLDFKRVAGGLLAQTADVREVIESDLKVVSKRKPTKKEIEDMLYAWKVNRHVKSNSIVFAKDGVAVGIGAGQQSRVLAVSIAAKKAGDRAKGAALASDAFFPFRDGVDEAAKAGITSVIHPGGSVRDQEVIDAANEHGMVMVFTGIRSFRH
jgi:phosphoribosylaminoimidazolecarboxamide formyltransferase/IMP cyclohydrolase